MRQFIRALKCWFYGHRWMYWYMKDGGVTTPLFARCNCGLEVDLTELRR